ncbi:MAG TPA: aminotransferase class V-fold PLP-dependent enzyme [Candidatus Paceibacterota bacterium]|nr:aminotransferase class V-fold PLP-dependent enzyme [Candidatus Paceibacterota bacterium]
MLWKTRRVYLDRAAGATGNPSSPHEEGREAKRRLLEARRTIARLVEAQADDVIFTGGATEANALAILGASHAWAARNGKAARVLYLPSAHASIVENAKMVANYGGSAEQLPVKDMKVDVEALRTRLTSDIALVTMEAVCGETGVVWNTREVAAAIKKSGHGTLLHVDASQAPLTEKIARSHFGADLMTLDASKVGNVRGIGALIAHRTIPLLPLYAGGGQERGLRPGSESPELAERFARALLAVSETRTNFVSAATDMREELLALLAKRELDGFFVNAGREQAPHIVNISLTGRDTDFLVALLDDDGFAVSTRSACETDSEEGSRAVSVLTGDSERAKSTLRISWGPEVGRSELRRFAEALGRAVAFVDSNARKGAL